MKRLKEQKGITLVALVITIIVLLILAGVALSLVVGENGITARAVNSRKTHNIAGAVEKVELEIANLASEFYQAKFINGSIEASGTVGDYVLEHLQYGQADGYSIARGTGSNADKITVTASDGTARTGTIGSDGKVAWEGVEYGTATGGSGGSGTGGGETPSETNYTVSFYRDSALTDFIESKTVAQGGTLEGNMPDTPTKEATQSYTYAFAGWKVGETAFTASTPVNANTSVYADWTQTPVATSAQWEMVTDTGTTGLTVGDLVKPTVTGVTSERFYVIGIGTGTDPVITLLAEKNVKTNDTTAANNVQSSSANTLAFDSSSNVYYTNSTTQSSIKGEVDTYVGKLTTAGLTLEDVETAEGGSAVSGVKGRLMLGTATGSWNSNYTTWTYSSGTGEIGALLDAGLTDLVYGPSTARLNYWLGSPLASGTSRAWRVIGSGSLVGYGTVSDSRSCGLRPVIKVLQSKF